MTRKLRPKVSRIVQRVAGVCRRCKPPHPVTVKLTAGGRWIAAPCPRAEG